MKKIVYTRIGGPDSIEIISEKLEKTVENQVKVRVYRAGINFADLMMRQGLLEVILIFHSRQDTKFQVLLLKLVKM